MKHIILCLNHSAEEFILWVLKGNFSFFGCLLLNLCSLIWKEYYNPTPCWYSLIHLLHVLSIFSCLQLNLFGEQITEGEATSMDAELLEDIMEQYEEISSSDKNKIKEIETENKGIFGASSIERPIYTCRPNWIGWLYNTSNNNGL